MKENSALDSIDLNDFLVPPEESSSQLCRSILRIILLSEEIRSVVLSKTTAIGGDGRIELRSILKKSQQYSESVDEEIEFVDEDEEARLRRVSNKLLEVGLRLKREIVRLSDRKAEDSLNEAVDPENIIEEDRVIVKATPEINVHSPNVDKRTNPWLIAATVLVAICTVAFYMVDFGEEVAAPVAADVEKFESKELPSSEHLKVAYKQDSMLFVTAKDSWKSLSAEEKQENLKQLLKVSKSNDLKNIVLTDGKGNFLADVSADGIRIEEPPA